MELEIRAEWDDDEKIRVVNSKINNLTKSETPFVWGTKDKWLTPDELFERGHGDCEDVAIAKYVILKEFNFDVELACVEHNGEFKIVVLVYKGGTNKVLDFPEKHILGTNEHSFSVSFGYDIPKKGDDIGLIYDDYVITRGLDLYERLYKEEKV
jgi:predicted transglutaminase-like cysteine proteinase